MPRDRDKAGEEVATRAEKMGQKIATAADELFYDEKREVRRLSEAKQTFRIGYQVCRAKTNQSIRDSYLVLLRFGSMNCRPTDTEEK